MWPAVQSAVVGAPHSVEPALQVTEVEGAQIFMDAPPGIGFEMDAVSQSPEVPEEQKRHGPAQAVVGICD